ncbi:MAG: formate dehydrogenase accessory sulfurtransferase FdhD [Gemmatimonadales bacterium]
MRPAKRGGRMADGAAVEEVPVWLEVNHRPVVTWMCTPEHLEELAIGWLAGEGYITSVDEVHLRPCATDLGFWAEIDAAKVAAVEAAPRRQVLASGCGAVGTWLGEESLSAATPTGRERPASPPPPEAPRLRELFKEVFARGDRYQDTGGIHAAALTDGESLLAHAEDIGRHNAVDKVVGAALLSRRIISGMGLLVTGRISAELAAKAAQAGLAWVATPSVPSTLAVEIARRSGMTLVGRAVSGTPHLHCAG